MKAINLRFVTPESMTELGQYLDELKFLSGFVPVAREVFMRTVINSVPDLTLVFDRESGLVLGAFHLDIHKKTVELHGVCRQDLKVLFPGRGHLFMQAFSRQLMHDVFVREGKKNLVIKVLDGSPGGRGFALLHGFRKINRDGKRTVYLLTRDRYLERIGQ